ncbi:antibiotic biosynthesis monooxygenase [Streptomyces sp. NPDC004680]|uniref:putative quinol monooxygenase n=1 Tax=Streptomyces sp. NPDC004680 TaxID=3154287 RepID=UPI0033A5A9E0
MIILNVFFDVTLEHETKFLKLLKHMVVESIKEDGCSLYQLWLNAHDPYSYVLVEHRETQDHLAAHGETPHWFDFNDTVNGYLKSDYEEHHYNEIPR